VVAGRLLRFGLTLVTATLAWGISAGLALAQPPSDPRAALRAQLDEGSTTLRQGNPKSALAIFTKALEPAERLGDQALLAKTLAGLGWAEWATGQYEKALATRKRALGIVLSLHDAFDETALRRGLGETYYSLGRYDEALEEYRHGIEAAKRANRPSEHGLILANMGSTYRSLGKLDDALKALEESVAVLRPLNNPGDLSLPFTFLGIVTRARGEFDRSIAFYNEALGVVRAEKNRRQESQILGNMGNVYLDLGRYEQAAALYRESLTIAEEIQYVAQIGFSNNNLGTVLNTVGRPAEALKHFEAALKIWRTSDRRAQIGWTLNNVGFLHARQRKDPKAALAALTEALQVASELKERQLEGFVRTNIGDIHLEAGRWTEALDQFEQSLALGRAGAGPAVEHQALSGRGMALRRLGRLEEAIKSLQESARIISDFRANVSSDSSKIAYLDTKQFVFHELAATLLDAGRTADAFEAAEAVRARALADLLNDRFVRTRPGEQEAWRELKQAVSASASDAVISEALEKLRRQSRELASLVTAETTKAEDAIQLAARLGDATLVEYLVTDAELLIWTVRSDGIRVHRSATPRTTIDEHVRSVLTALKAPTGDPKRTSPELSSGLRVLHQLLIEPVADRLPRDPEIPLIIVPHGSLLLLPFSLLANPSGTPLVDRHTLASAPALSVFRFVRERPAAASTNIRTALVIADPMPPPDAPLERLPAAQDEGRAVQRRLASSKVTLLTGTEASESTVKRDISSSDIVHLATHGLVSEQRPLASSLMLSAGGGEDGYLRADEVFGLELQADLVVLSGCSTGTGRLSSDGLLGLTRAFLYAGTPSLIVSYWDVSDAATVYLMDRFYAALGRGLGKAAALRTAQLEARRRYAHPSYWAGFGLIGQPR
jgi:CHAT domain-containing protein/Tfp pilus assembly protein PilF